MQNSVLVRVRHHIKHFSSGLNHSLTYYASIDKLFKPVRSQIQKIHSFLCRTFTRSSKSLQYNAQFLSGSSGSYIEDMYRAWQKDPNSVHVSWDSYFRNEAAGKPYASPSNLSPTGKNVIYQMPLGQQTGGPAKAPSTTSSAATSSTDVDDHLSVQSIIRNFQIRGHYLAQLDPLKIVRHDIENVDLGIIKDNHTTYSHKLIQRLKAFMDRKDVMDKTFKIPEGTFIGAPKNELPLRDILERLKKVYCGSIGVEYMHVDSVEICTWLRQRLETPGVGVLTPDEKKLLLLRLAKATGFESFLAKKWASEKRFGLEGGEALIPCMKTIIDQVSLQGCDSVVIGMPHRGRLNVLINVCGKPLHQLLTQFHGLEPTDDGSGDVKYHLGTHTEVLNKVTNKKLQLTVMANPSHLEVVAPLVEGRVFAEQFYRNDVNGEKVLPVILHGDASYSGQGICFETMHLSELVAYTTKGTIHIVVNNQIGFTTDPRHSRSSPYCTDVARVVNAPIFHVNGDDPEAVVHVSKIAADYRSIFHKDIVIDIVSYRRNGHNEIDEPMFTQPLMYKKIKATVPVFQQYAQKLIAEGVINKEFVDKMMKDYEAQCEEAFEKSRKETHIRLKDWLDSPWRGFFKGKDPMVVKPTGVDEETIVHIGNKFSEAPKDFALHKGIERILKARAEMVKNKIADWSMGEAFAYGSLLKDGIHVRLSGQDVERGTFSHRHHVLHDQNVDGKRYRPLDNLFPKQAKYAVHNSSLSEFGILGFEVGFSVLDPNALVMWEGQFGDFFNTAQVVVDQFLASGQSKWVRQCGLVMQLPHGMEGMGPEHSSARVERFLQMSADDAETLPPDSDNFAMKQLYTCNWIIANCTTPANLFHILRRQIAFPFRKPLILMTPKSLLRHPDARSPFADFVTGSEFQRVIPENGEASKNPSGVKKLLLCSGKVYYDLLAERKTKNMDKEIALTRLEQLSPFPYDKIKKEVEKYSSAKICFVQEEHKNQGPYSYVEPRMFTLLKGQRTMAYVGRAASPSPATGSKVQHYAEIKAFMTDAMAL